MPQFAPISYIHSPIVGPVTQSVDWNVLQGAWSISYQETPIRSGTCIMPELVGGETVWSDVYGTMVLTPPRTSNIQFSGVITGSGASGSSIFGLSYSPLTHMGSSNFYWKVTEINGTGSYRPYVNALPLAVSTLWLVDTELKLTVDGSNIYYYVNNGLVASSPQSLTRPVYPHICVAETGSATIGFNWIEYKDLVGTYAISGSPTAINTFEPQLVIKYPLGDELVVESGSGGGWNIAWSPYPTESGMFCSVGARTVATLIDGINWTQQANLSSNLWQGICWSNPIEGRQFVAVASSGPNNRVMTSPDGISWTTRTSPQNNNWVSVDYSPKLHKYVAVAVAGDNKVMFSRDGVNWALGNLTDPAAAYTSVCWGGTGWGKAGANKFCIVGKGGSHRVLVSGDGINWEGCGSPGGAYSWRDVCWSPKLNFFCAISEGTASATMLSNGISGSQTGAYTNLNGSWNVYPLGYSARLAGIAWSDELEMFCVTTEANINNHTMYFSSDGINWTNKYNGNAKENWSGVAYSPIQHTFVTVNQIGSMSLSTTAPSTLMSASMTRVYTSEGDLPHEHYYVQEWQYIEGRWILVTVAYNKYAYISPLQP